jgi:hypothetical protein
LGIFPLQVTPQLIRSLRAFTARSSERDVINDEARIAAVEHAVDEAISGLTYEKRGLIGRVKRTVLSPQVTPAEAVAPASGQDSPFAQAEARLRLLDEQIRMFECIKALLGKGRSLFGASAAGSATSPNSAPRR